MMMGLRKAAQIPDVAADKMVHIMILGALFERGKNMLIVEPPLKKSQQVKRRMVPKTTKGKELISKQSSFCNLSTHHSTSCGLFWLLIQSIASCCSSTFYLSDLFFSFP